ncbi:MAG: glycosyltransferase family 4 protein [Rubripirellula sp.]|nr:glycosyltransferase family 4 protein [Rubripirellula sp.]
MRIAYEGLIYQMLPLGGIARYIDEIIERLPEEDEPCVLLPNGFEFSPKHPQLKTASVAVEFPIASKTANKLLGRYWRRYRWKKIQTQYAAFQADLHHWSYYCGLCYRPVVRRNKPTVVTIYDFIFQQYPELDKNGKQRQWMENAIRTADRLICISQATYHDLCNRFPTAASKAVVTPLGNSFSSVTASPLPDSLRDRPYLLFVGRRTGYKNFITIWKAWKKARERHKDLQLVAAGPPLSEREARQLNISPDESGFLSLGKVSDPVLKSLYQNCKAFVFPSHMEGFGLPAVEAMESGCLVLASNCEALKEVCGGAAYHFDSVDTDALTQLIEIAVTIPEAQKKSRIADGKQQASRFSWDQTAEQTLSIYRDLTDQSV